MHRLVWRASTGCCLCAGRSNLHLAPCTQNAQTNSSNMKEGLVNTTDLTQLYPYWHTKAAFPFQYSQACGRLFSTTCPRSMTRSHPLSPLIPSPPHFIPIVGISIDAISITAEQSASWSGCAGLGHVHTAGCVEHSPQAKETTLCHHHEPTKSLPSKSVYPQLSPAAGSMRQRGKAALLS